MKDILETGNAVQSLTGEAQHRKQKSNCRGGTLQKRLLKGWERREDEKREEEGKGREE